MNQLLLKRLPVNDCFGQFAWHGDVAAVLPVAGEERPKSWKVTCVEDFFRQYNWAGRTVVAVDTHHAQAETDFSICLPVQQFFDCFVWAGQPEIAPQPMSVEDTPAPSADHDFKLSNFSNLF